MADLGVPFRVEVSRFDESQTRHLSPRTQALAAAQGKAREVRGRFPRSWVLGSDTVVCLRGRALGQPVDADDARRMLALLAGTSHSVMTAVAVVDPDGRERSRIAISRVAFAPLRQEEIDAYVETGEPMDKAGAYAIQGGAGDFAGLQRGSLDTVIGLPRGLVRRLLLDLGYPVAERAVW
jgi:septum formation protein